MPELRKKVFQPELVMLVFAILVSAFFKSLYFNGLVMADDFSYGVYAFSLFREPLPWDMSLDFRALRFSLLLPVAVLYRFFPPTEVVSVLYPLLLSFGAIVVVFGIARKLAGPTAGGFAALVMALMPGNIRFGTMLLPDVVAQFYIACAVLLFVYAEQAKDRKTFVWYALSGVSVFLAFNARENSYYFMLFFLPFAFNRNRWKRGLYMAGVGFAVPVLLLYLLYWVKSGDFLYNLHLAQKYRDPLIKSGYIPPNSINWHMIFYYMFPGFFPARSEGFGLTNPVFGLTFLLGVPVLIYHTIRGLKKRDRMLLIIPWWFLTGYLFLEFGTVSFSSYHMMRKLPRFLLIVTPAVAVAGGLVLSQMFSLIRERLKKKNKLVVSIIQGIIVSVIIMILSYSVLLVVVPLKYQTWQSMDKYRWAYYAVLKDMPRKPIYITGGFWKNKLSFYMLPDKRYIDVSWKRSDMLRDLRDVRDPSKLAGSYVIIDRTHFTGENDLGVNYSYDEFDSFVQLPPNTWTYLGNQSKVEIYEVPDGWTYDRPGEYNLLMGTFRHGLLVNDPMLILQTMHPDYLKSVRPERFNGMLKLLRSYLAAKDVTRFTAALRTKDYEGKLKIIIDMK